MAGLWTMEDRQVFVGVVLGEARRLGHSEAGFEKTSWTRITNLTNESARREFDRSQLQSQLQQLKKKYVVFSSLKDNSGFGWCSTTGLPTAPQAVWDAYLLAHPKAKEFQDKPLPMYDELHEIFSGVVDTGRFASSTNEPSDYSRHREMEDSESGSEQDVRDFRGDAPPRFSSGGSELSSSVSEPPPTPTPRRSPSPNEKTRPGKRPASSGERISSALEKLADVHEKRTKQKREPSEPKPKRKTDAQLAVQDFIEEYRDCMSAVERVKYVHYFMCNKTSAEMYIMLDDETKKAFIGSLFKTGS